MVALAFKAVLHFYFSCFVLTWQDVVRKESMTSLMHWLVCSMSLHFSGVCCFSVFVWFCFFTSSQLLLANFSLHVTLT